MAFSEDIYNYLYLLIYIKDAFNGHVIIFLDVKDNNRIPRQ